MGDTPVISSESDPRGYLKLAPELAAIAERDADVARAMAEGSGRRLHQALRRRLRSSGGEPHQKPELEALLANRRLFLDPASAPPLFTWWGIGTTLHGKSDEAPDGTSIATLSISVLFVPLFPLAQYLVRNA